MTTAIQKVSIHENLKRFENLFGGLKARAFIIGKGPSLDALEKVVDKIYGPVFCLNESIQKVEQFIFTHAVFVVQQDCTEKMADKCVPTKDATHFMNCWHNVATFGGREKRLKVERSKWNPKAVLYEPADFGEFDVELSAVMALHLARLMGCKAVTFCCFDSWAPNGSCEYAKIIEESGSKSGDFGEPGRHRTNKDHILNKAIQLGFEADVLLPDGSSYPIG